MPKRTEIYNFYTLQFGDKIFAGFDQDNFYTVENEAYGIFTYLGPGVITGWEATSMKYDPTNPISASIELEKQQLIDAYRTNIDSFLAQQYIALGFPEQDWEWGQVLRVSSGTGIVGPYPAKTEYVHYFRLSSINFYYAWAAWGPCIDTSGACEIVVPLDPDEDYDITNMATFLCEVQVGVQDVFLEGAGTVTLSSSSSDVYGNGTSFLSLFSNGDHIKINNDVFVVNSVLTNTHLTITTTASSTYIAVNYYYLDQTNQIVAVNNTERRNNLQNFSSLQDALRAKFLRHVHTGVGEEPSKIDLSSEIIINCSIISGSDILTFTLPSGFNASSYGFPAVLLNDVALNPADYTLSLGSGLLYLKNSVYLSDSVQIVLPLSPQTKLFIQSGLALNINFPLLLTDGSTTTTTDDLGDTTITQNTFVWNPALYEDPQVYAKTVLLSSRIYTINPSQGTITFISALPPGGYIASDITVILTAIGKQITGTLSGERTQNIDASTFNKGTLDINRLTQLDHVGLFRFREHAVFTPTLRLFSRGDQKYYYPEITTSDLQYNSVINFGFESNNYYLNSPSFLLATQHGLIAANGILPNFNGFLYSPHWFSDVGQIVKIYDEYWGQLVNYNTGSQTNLDNKEIFILTSTNDLVTGYVYYSTDAGETWFTLKTPFVNGAIPTIQSFYASQDIIKITENIFVDSFSVNRVYYLGTAQGFFSATILPGQGSNDWNWSSQEAISYVTGIGNISVNSFSYMKDVKEAVNVKINTIIDDNGNSSTTYDIERTIYLATDLGLFRGDGSTFTRFEFYYDQTNTLYSPSINSILWLENGAIENVDKFGLYWVSDNDIFASYYAEKIVNSSDSGSTTQYNQPLTLNLQPQFSDVDFTYDSNVDLNRAPASIAGTVLTLNKRILVKSQTDLTQNGIYSVTLVTSDSGGAYTVWTRTNENYYTGESTVRIKYTSPTYPNSIWYLPTLDNGLAYIVGTTSIVWRIYAIKVFSHILDATHGPFIQIIQRNFNDQLFAVHTKGIYWIHENTVSHGFVPSLISLDWDVTKYGTIKSAYHSNVNDADYGTLYVFTDSGAYQSTASLFNPSINGHHWLRLENVFPENLQTEISVYDQQTLNQIQGKLLNVIGTPYISSGSVPDGIYKNLPLFYSNSSGYNASIDLTIVNNIVTDYDINNTGLNFANILFNATTQINTAQITIPQITTEGVIYVDFATQSITFSQLPQPNYKNLLYAKEYFDFSVRDWPGSDSNTSTFVAVYIGNDTTPLSLNLIPDQGLIQFANSVGLANKDNVYVTIIKDHAFISNVGVTPHLELTNIFITEPTNATTLNQEFTTQLVLPVVSFSSIPASTTYLKLSATNLVPDILQVYVDVANQTINVLSRSTSQTFPAGTFVYIVVDGRTLGIEDKLTLSKTNLTYNLQSIENQNTIQLAAQASNFYDLFGNFYVPGSNDQPYFGIDRGLKNTIFSSEGINIFNNPGSSSSLFIGVLPSEEDNASVPQIVFTFGSSYGSNPLVIGTEKGIWQYDHNTSKWSQQSSLNNSGRVFFVNSNYSGASTGLWQYTNGAWTPSLVYVQEVLDYHTSEVWDSNSSSSTYYDAVAKSDGLAFVYYSDNTLSKFTSDYFEPLRNKTIYNIYHDYFESVSDNPDGSVTLTLTPALYLGSEDGLWAVGIGSKTVGGLGSLLTGREVLVSGNPSIQIPITFNGITIGTRPPKVYKTVRTIAPLSVTKQPIPILVLTSNGIFKVINWRACDPTDVGGLNFYISNLNNCLIGRSCYCIVQKSYLNSTVSFVGTDNGVYRTDNNGDSFATTEKIAGGATTVYDLQIVTGSNSVDYLIAATDKGLFVSPDFGESWLYPDDSSIAIELLVSRYITNSILLNANYYGQSFTVNSSLNQQLTVSGTVNKVSVYLSTISTGDATADSASANNNVQASIAIYDNSGNLITTYMATNIVYASDIQYPGFVSFIFNPFTITANQKCILILKETLNTDINAQYIIRWHTSNLNQPFIYGSAITSPSNSVNFNSWTTLQSGLDFYFKIYFALNQSIQTIQVPVGRIDNSYPNGFLDGTGRGIILDRSGNLTTDIKLLVSLNVDYSKSINWSEPLDNSQIDQQQNKLNDYFFNNSDSLWNRTNSQSYMDIWEFGTYIVNLSNGIANNFLTLENYILSITNRGKHSPLFDDLGQSLVSVYPQSIIDTIIQPIDTTTLTIEQQQLLQSENISNLQTLQTYLDSNNLIDLSYVKSLYMDDLNNYAELTVLGATGAIVIGTQYQLTDSSQLFAWSENYYQNSIVTVSGVSVSGATLYPSTGQIGFSYSYGNLENVKVYLSYDWTLDPSTFQLIDDDWIYSDFGSNEIVSEWANSFNPLILVISDGEDTSSTSTIDDISGYLENLWDGDGVGANVFALNQGNDQKNLRDISQISNGIYFDIVNANSNGDWDTALSSFYNTGDNSVFGSSWQCSYDYETKTFIKRVVSQYTFNSINGASVNVSFRYSLDRVNYSSWITVPSNAAGITVMQSVYAIEYKVVMNEGFDGSNKSRPVISQLYHEIIVPTYQYLFTDSHEINGMLFEYISSASLNKSNLTKVNFGICRGDSLDYTYYEPILLGRNSVLVNRQNTILYTDVVQYTKIPLQTSDNQTFLVIDDQSNPITWIPGEDKFAVYQIVNSQNRYYDPQFYQQFGASSKIIFNNPQIGIGTLYADITIVPKLYTLVGEKTTTNDFQTYYLTNGVFPPDASIIILVNDEVQRGGYIISYDTGSITFSVAKDRTDVVTAYIQFSDVFRVGMEIISYTSEAIDLGNFALTYTVKNNGDVIRDYNNFPVPEINNLQLLPLNPNFTNKLYVDYNFSVIRNAVESGTKTQWYRLRTGLETIQYNNNAVSPAPGQTLSFVLNSVAPVGLATTNTVGYSLNVNLNSTGHVIGISIASRGYNLNPLSPLNVQDNVTVNNVTYSGFQSIFSNINVFNANAVDPAYQYKVGVNTFIQITSSNLVGIPSFNGITTIPMPEYNNRFSEKSIDITSRTLFDAYDTIFVAVQPSTGSSVGQSYISNQSLIRPSYTPIILGTPQVAVQYISASPITIAAGQIVPVSYTFLSNVPGISSVHKSGNTGIGADVVSWYAVNKNIGENQNAPIYTGGVLPSAYVLTGNQIYYTVTPINGPDIFGVYDSGITYISDIILVK